MGVPPQVQPMFVYSIKRKHCVTLHSWVCHLKYSLCLFTPQKEKTGSHCTHGCATKSTAYVCLLYIRKTLGHTLLMGVPPKVQPMFVHSTKRKHWVTLHSLKHPVTSSHNQQNGRWICLSGFESLLKFEFKIFLMLILFANMGCL